MDQYNEPISDFFKNENHWNKENRVYEEELFELIKKFDTNFDVFSESRNYEHCITFTIDYESNGLSHSTFDNSLIENHNFETSSETIEFYRMAIYVSDILPLLNYSWNHIKLTDKKSIQIIPKNSLPEPIKIIFHKLETTILTETKFVILDSNQLSKKATWFQHPQLNVESMYQPTYFDLLFGGLDLYNALGI